MLSGVLTYEWCGWRGGREGAWVTYYTFVRQGRVGEREGKGRGGRVGSSRRGRCGSEDRERRKRKIMPEEWLHMERSLSGSEDGHISRGEGRNEEQRKLGLAR